MNLFETGHGVEIMERIVRGIQTIAEELQKTNELKAQELELYAKLLEAANVLPSDDWEDDLDWLAEEEKEHAL